MGFGARLKQLRTERGLKQSDLGELLGVSNVAISHYESESRSPDPETLAKIAKFFNISVDNLLGVENYDKNIDLKELLQSGSMSFGGKEISEENLKVLTRVISSFLEEEWLFDQSNSR